MIAVDSSVIIDFLFDGPSSEASAATLREAAERGRLALSDVTLAEVCARGQSDAIRGVLQGLGFQYHPTNETAAARAGEMLQRYRLRSGTRARTVADFLVGAHALIQCEGLITLDAGFHRDYFKGLRVIVPGERQPQGPLQAPREVTDIVCRVSPTPETGGS